MSSEVVSATTLDSFESSLQRRPLNTTNTSPIPCPAYRISIPLTQPHWNSPLCLFSFRVPMCTIPIKMTTSSGRWRCSLPTRRRVFTTSCWFNKLYKLYIYLTAVILISYVLRKYCETPLQDTTLVISSFALEMVPYKITLNISGWFYVVEFVLFPNKQLMCTSLSDTDKRRPCDISDYNLSGYVTTHSSRWLV